MEKIKFSKNDFNKNLFDINNIFYISCEKYWDGGYEPSAALNEKADFYRIANQFANIIKEIVSATDDTLIIGSEISEKGCLFESWKDLKNYDAYNNLYGLINKKCSYMLNLPDDSNIVDYIVENNFRYFSCIDFYLPKSKAVLQPTCHTELFIYSKNYDLLLPIVKNILQDYQGFYLKKYISE